MSFLNFLAWLFAPRQSQTLTMWTSDEMSPEAMAAMSVAEGNMPGVGGPTLPQPPMWQQAKDQIAALQKVDPNFSDISFLESATKLYQAALTAENDMNPGELGPAATQAFHDQLAQRIADWRASGHIRKVTNLDLDPPSVLKVAVDGTQQRITVRFTGTAARFTVDASNGVVVDGNKQPDLFTEFAMFTRPAGTTTAPSVAQGAPAHCPGCGAPVEPGSTVCPYCSTPLTGTASAWQIDHLSASPYT